MDDVDVRPLYLVAFAVATTLAMLLGLSIGQRRRTPDPTGGSPARRLVGVGQVLAVFLVASSAVRNSVTGQSIAHDVIWVSAFGFAGVVLIAITGRLGVRLLLHSRLPAEIERGNVAAGLAAGAHYAATGIITSRAVAGHDLESLALSIAFFVIAQVTFHVFVSLFRALTTYDDTEQIAGENLAAAISYSGAAIALAIIIARAAEGEFTGWASSLKGYGAILTAAIALYPVRQLFVQMLLLRAPFRLRGGPLDDGIAIERNAGIGALEAVSYIATALTIARLT